MKKKLLALGLCLLILLPALSGCGQKDNAAEIVMYDGINTEMQLVHRMIKLLVEDRTDAAVTIKDQMSGVNMFKEMTGNKSCDLFNSYDGTLLTTFLKLDPADVPEGVSLYDFANEQAMEQYGVRLLDQLGIAVRSGHHCAQLLLSSLGLDYALRVSPAYYNTPEEIEALAHGLERIIPMLRRG